MNNKQLNMPRVLLHAEGLVVFATAIAVYAMQGNSWWTFALVLLLPDLSIIGYAISPKIGSWAYNIAHTYVVPLIVGLLAMGLGSTMGVQLAIIWVAHIGMDRMIGYGLKYTEGFKMTHMGRI